MKIESDLETFFRNEREKVLRCLKGRYRLDDSNAWICYSDGCDAVRRNIVDGKLNEDNLTCSLSTYLMSCCRHHALKMLAKKKGEKPFELFEGILSGGGEGDIGEEDIRDGDYDDDEMINVLEKIIRNLPEPCNTILWNVYYNYHEIKQECQENETIMDVIALMLGMKKTVLKTTKNRCLNKVKEKVKTM